MEYSDLAGELAREVADYISEHTALEINANTVALRQKWCVSEVAKIIQKAIDAKPSHHRNVNIDVLVKCGECGQVISRVGGQPTLKCECGK